MQDYDYVCLLQGRRMSVNVSLYGGTKRIGIAKLALDIQHLSSFFFFSPAAIYRLPPLMQL
jgi:hypothetical protein